MTTKTEIVIDWAHWLLGVNWGRLSPTLNQTFLAIHFGPWCYLATWTAPNGE